ncbi:hypothetical protein [Prevotella dentasini]|uniref:hypothetical protein n=1 Tax=Prevotella dentasini TaxID=589537 RepID=UPI0035710CE9
MQRQDRTGQWGDEPLPSFAIGSMPFSTQINAMNIQDIQKIYAALPQAGALLKMLEDKSVKTVFLQGLVASSAPMLFASIAGRWGRTILFVLNDNDEAGYFYNDLKTLAASADGEDAAAEVLFFLLPTAVR